MTNISTNFTEFNNNDHNPNITSSKFGCYTEEVVVWLTWIIISTGLPLTLVAIVALFSLVRNDHVAPIYVINLLISDLIQLCCLTSLVQGCEMNELVVSVYDFGLLVSIGFMVCISLERYLVIAWPLWYRFRRTIKVSVVVCAVVWTLPLVYIFIVYLGVDLKVRQTIFAVYLLLPFPLFIFFLGGTLKALSASLSVPSDEKRRIVAILVVVLLIHTLLFLPNIVWFLAEETRDNNIFDLLSTVLLDSSPLADLTLYILMRRGATDKILASLCCCRMKNNQQLNNMNDENMLSVSVM